MELELIPTYVISGFLEAGKTTYINKAIARDFFYKRGSTLILAFEEGEQDFDYQLFQSRNTMVETYKGGDIAAFYQEMIDKHHPDRIYIETNCMNDDLWKVTPNNLKIVFNLCIIAKDSFSILYNNLRTYLQRMVANANMVIFNRFEKEELQPYATTFKLLNKKAEYLWQSSLGYSERAFGIMVPYDLNSKEIVLSESDFPCWYLDASEKAENYEGKIIEFDGQLKIVDDEEITYKFGRIVMTCCMSDLAFLAFPVEQSSNDLLKKLSEGQWCHLKTKCQIKYDKYRQKQLFLNIETITAIESKDNKIIGIK